MWKAEKFSCILNEQEGHLLSLFQPLCCRNRSLFCSLFVMLKAGIIIPFSLVQERQSAVYGC